MQTIKRLSWLIIVLLIAIVIGYFILRIKKSNFDFNLESALFAWRSRSLSRQSQGYMLCIRYLLLYI